MKKLQLLLTFLFIAPFGWANNVDLTSNFITGNPQIQSINALAFGPQGILFIGDSRSANIVALDTQESMSRGADEAISIKNLDQQIANLLGTTSDKVNIQDMAVNPETKTIYLAVHLPNGTPVLLKTSGKELKHVALDNVRYSHSKLEKAIAEDAKDRRGRSQRHWAISDLAYTDGNVMVSGLSSEEFASTFRSISFPFKDEQMYASLEIYHAAHGQYETHSPIKAFLPYEFNGKPHLVASYTCTPLVIFPLDQMEKGKHVKGKTVAELGNRNTPLDIISYKKNDKPYILMANSSRALMKIDPEKVATYKEYLTEPVKENSATAGVDFIALPYVNVQQLADYNDQFVVMVQRKANGSLDLETVSKRRL